MALSILSIFINSLTLWGMGARVISVLLFLTAVAISAGWFGGFIK